MHTIARVLLGFAAILIAAGGLFAALFGNSLLGWYTSLFR